MRVDVAEPSADRLGLELLPGVNLDPDRDAVHAQLRRPQRRHAPASPRSTAAAPIQVCVDPASGPHDLVRDKGHMDGLIARAGGVLVRAGHTEGSVDLCRLAGLREVAVICEVLNAGRHDGPPAGPARRSAASTA